MDAKRPSGIHQTILVVAVALAAVIGSVSGAVGAVLMTGAINGSDIVARISGTPKASVVTDRRIVQMIEEESASISVVDTVAPSVVSVIIKKPWGAVRADEANQSNSGFFDPLNAPPLPDIPPNQDPNELVEIGGGSGFFMSSDGYIVTNRHVVSDDGATYTVVTNDGVELPAKVVARDAFLDIAVLDVAGDGYPVATLGDSDKIRIGSTVIAIGNTLSEYRNTVTKGVISGINRSVTAGDDYGSDEVIDRAIQTDAAINPGNSGGPLIDLLGEVIGINSAVSYDGQSIGFAIPINDVKKIVDDIGKFGRIVRPWLGVRYLEVDKQLASDENLSVDYGVYVTYGNDPTTEPAVSPGSPAEKAGIREGDVILSVNGQKLTDHQTLGSVISQYNPGDTVSLKVARGEEAFDLSVALEELKAQ
ncbi:MAG: trypsin-like peptidase domain-containing protein [Candidatus Uhrbacteria bacterium]